MNGQEYKGVSGFSKMTDDFAPFPNNDSFLESNQYQKCTGETNDLRFERQNYQS